MPRSNRRTGPHQPRDTPAPSTTDDFLGLWTSWSPTEAMEARGEGKVGAGRTFETLHDYISAPSMVDVACCVLASCQKHLPGPDETVRVFQSVRVASGSPKVILPGAAVSNSPAHARLLDERDGSSTYRLLWTDVYPDELVTFCTRHHFIYVPRSATVAYDRYMRDSNRLRLTR